MKSRLVLIASVLMITACGSTKIGRITADPSRYFNRSVSVTGTVVNSFGVLGTGGYQIEDDTGKIYVISTTGIPSKGAKVKVKGTVLSAGQIAGRSLGTAIRERSHDLR
jgi:hypothetical protein